MESPGKYYADLWKQYCHLTEAFRNGIATFKEREREQQDDDDDDLSPFKDISRKALDSLEESATSTIQLLTWEAEKRFAPPNGRLTIDRRDFEDLFLSPFMSKESQRGWSEFDPVAVWHELERRYGGQRGLVTGYQQAAETIIDGFALKPGTTIKRTAGYVVLNLRVYPDPYDRRNVGAATLCLSSREDLRKLITAIETFARWANDDDTVFRLPMILRRRFDWRDPITSRERITVSDAMSIVTYRTRFEFRFGATLSEQLQLFLAEYGAKQFATAV